MKVMTVRLDDRLYEKIRSLVKSGEFKSVSDVVRIAVVEFLSRRKLRWRDRRELREYLSGKKKEFVSSGKIIEDVRREEDWVS